MIAPLLFPDLKLPVPVWIADNVFSHPTKEGESFLRLFTCDA
jgi:hypothetical protein